MAYLDTRGGTRQRAATFAIVAALQGAAIVALVNGLAVRFIAPMPEARVAGEQLTLPPPPPPIPQPSEKVRPPVASTRVTAPLIPNTFAKPADFVRPNDDPIIFTSGPGEIVRPSDPPPPPPLPPSITPRAARPGNDPGAWATTSDYPASDLRNGNRGMVRFRLGIGADGRVRDCTIVASSGFAGLDAATCRNVSRRARFEPATDDTGAPAVGSYDGSIRWTIPD